MTIKPPLKWVGGKSQILTEVLAKFPAEMQSYHEPFVGGGSVLLEVLRRRSEGELFIHGGIYASDINPALIALYKNIQSHPNELLAELEELTAPPLSEPYYYEIRTRFNSLSQEDRLSPQGSAMLLFLNKTCFRGLYREGPKGFNVPYGNYKKPTIFERDHILQLSALLHDVVFTCCSFETALSTSRLQCDDFVYMDPPYAPEAANSFVGYTSHGFKLEDHQRLFDICSSLPSMGVRMLMSNANVPLVRDAFQSPAFHIETIRCRRAIHSKQPGSTTLEVLIRDVEVDAL